MSSADFIPKLLDVSKIYSSEQSVKKEKSRWSKDTQHFENIYGHAPDFVARAPGRVNIIGE